MEEEQQHPSRWHSIICCAVPGFVVYTYISLRILTSVGFRHGPMICTFVLAFYIFLALVVGITCLFCRPSNLDSGHQGDRNEDLEANILHRLETSEKQLCFIE